MLTAAPSKQGNMNILCKQGNMNILWLDTKHLGNCSTHKYLLVLSLLALRHGAGLILSIGMVGQLRRTHRHGAVLQSQFEIKEDARVLLSDERVGDTALAGATGSSNTMRVICKEIDGTAVSVEYDVVETHR